MSERNFQLTKKQQELLLRGLRFVRSSVALDMREWSEEVDVERGRQYDEIARIESLLNHASIVEPAAV
jgi:hypothetical protein